VALAETAELAVKLSLNDAQFGQAINRIDRRLGAFSGAVNRNLGRAFDAALLRGARALTNGFQAGVESLRTLELAMGQTEAVIKSTGGAAGVTADEVRNLAEKYEDLNATIDDKVIQSAENLLLTFTNVSKEAFEPALATALDLSTALKIDLTSATKTLGRALNDPAAGISRLERLGVSLDDATKDRIKTMQEEGDLLGAQKVLLDELATRYGGSFARAGETAAGSQARLRDKIEEVQMAFADKLLPVVVKVSDRISNYLAKPETIAFFDRLGGTIASLFTDENLDTAAMAIETAASAVGTAITAFNSLPPEIKALAIGALTLNKVTGGAVGGAAEAFGKVLGAGLKQIFAAHVTVVGKTVTGGVPGVDGTGTGGTSTIANVLKSAAAVTAGVAVAEGLKGLGEILSDAVHEGNTEAVEAQNKINDLMRGMALGPFEALRSLPEQLDRLINGNKNQPAKIINRFGDDGPSATDDRAVAFRASEHAALDGPTFNTGINRLKDNLREALDRQTRAERNGNDRNARMQGNKVDRLRDRIQAGLKMVSSSGEASVGRLQERLGRKIAQEERATRRGDARTAREAAKRADRIREKLELVNRTTKGEGNQSQNLQRGANSKLDRIAKKDLSVKVNVSSAISVATYVRGVAVSTRYGGNNSVTAI
jgi:hypothetical protein